MYSPAKPIPKGSRAKAGEVAAAHLRKTNNRAVGHGDSGLLHEICEALGWPHEGWQTEGRVLSALDAYHGGHLVKRLVHCGRNNRTVRIFYLPEHDPWPERPCYCLECEKPKNADAQNPHFGKLPGPRQPVD